MSLPVESPGEALARDEALLEAFLPRTDQGLWPAATEPHRRIEDSDGHRADGADDLGPGDPSAESLEELLGAWPRLVVPSGSLMRFWLASRPAVVVGLGSRSRLASIVDLERCRAASTDVLDRRAGGGAVLVDQHLLCGAVCVPLAAIPADVTASYRWLGDQLVRWLTELGIKGARRVEVDEARADVAALRGQRDNDPLAGLLLATCYAALSPHEIVVDGQKLVGLAQIRRQSAALFQFGILLEDQSPLADLLAVPDESLRTRLSAALRERTVGLRSLLPQPDQASGVSQ